MRMADPNAGATSMNTGTTATARVHCDKCNRESDVAVARQTTNTGKVFWQGQCAHCNAAVYAVVADVPAAKTETARK